MSYLVYLLHNKKNLRTYIGCTNNIERRIRQHRCEIKGGATYTSCYDPEHWEIDVTVHGFQSKSEALSFEWHAKHIGRKVISGLKPRRANFGRLLSMEKWSHLSFKGNVADFVPFVPKKENTIENYFIGKKT
jgi:predicted GIY-YIG superfamily endonuclease